MSDEATMAATAVAAVAPYLAEAGKEGAKKLGEEAAGGTVKLLGWLKAKLTPGGQDALAKLEQAPADADRQAALRVALRDRLAEDPAFKDELAKLIQDIPQVAIDQRLVQEGCNNRGAQVAGSGNHVSVR